MNVLKLNIDPKGWSLFNKRKADKAFQRYTNKVFALYENTCGYCGFKDNISLEVLNRDNDYNNNKISNMIAGCKICTQCHFVQDCNLSKVGGGDLIYMPELSQHEINGLCHSIFKSIYLEDKNKSVSQSIYRKLKYRRKIFENIFGENYSDPSLFSNIIQECGISLLDGSSENIKNVRLLPSYIKFLDLISEWYKNENS